MTYPLLPSGEEIFLLQPGAVYFSAVSCAAENEAFESQPCIDVGYFTARKVDLLAITLRHGFQLMQNLPEF